MRPRLLRAGAWLLVVAVVLFAAAGCQREAEVRGPGTEVAPDGPPAGETVVSAVTPTPDTGGLATPQSGTEQPPVVAPTETARLEPVPTSTPEPVAAETEEPAVEGEYVWHTVAEGETLSIIAVRYETTVAAIVKANGLDDPNQITVGQKLKIPTSEGTTGGTTGGTDGCRYRHTVTRGEWIWQIARTYDVSPYAILKANGLTIQSADTIYPGMVLCIP